MNLRVQKIVEFDKVKKIMSEKAVCSQTCDYVLNMKPTSDTDICSKWLDDTDSAVRYILKRGKIPLRPVKSMDTYLQIAKIGGIIYNRELLQIKDLLHVARCIRDHLTQFQDKEDKSTWGIAEQLVTDLYTNRRLEEKIGGIVLSEDEIADDASPVLKSVRRSIVREQETIKDKLNALIRSPALAKYLQDPIITIRKDRYVIPVKAEYRSEIKGLIHDSSSSGQTFFIEPLSVLESNNHIKELARDEDIEIERILRELSEDIGTAADSIKQMTLDVFKLDFFFTKAAFALDINGIRPKINRNGKIRIIKGRHPLIPKNEVVPIDYEMGGEYNSVVITGPNTGGKTVSLKTIGLFTLMTEAGIFIPASTGSEISLFKEVFADIGDEQSIEQSLSTFSSHMTNIVHILERAKSSHLVLLDELGAGTDPVEGAALAMSILENLRYRNISCISTTHYSELKIYALNTKGVINASCEFDLETLKPTYRLLIGIPGKSNAFEISKKLGLSANITDMAKKYISEKDMDFETTISQLQQYKNELEKDRELAKKYRLEAEEFKNSLEKLKKDHEERKQDMIAEAKREAYEIIRNAKKEVNAILSEAKNMSDIKGKIEINSKLNKLLSGSETDANERDSESGLGYRDIKGRLKVGDDVFSARLNSQAQVVSEADENDEVTVAAGMIKIKLKTSELKYIDKDTVMKENKSGGRFISKSMDIKTEIDLRGQNVEDAIALIDKYLDDAHLSGLHQVTLIHGKGTGVLREGIAGFLKRHPQVQAFRLGQMGEGESGVTVVTLK
jgi:DNA mismatch repair protein MutS2